jgi:ribonuclease HII
MRFPDFKKELKYIDDGYLVIGCDEVGRGPLAGPVVAAACILDHKSIDDKSLDKWYSRIRDSKTIKEEEREILNEKILHNSTVYGIGEVWQEEIDNINIHNASLLAMKRAIDDLMNKIKIRVDKIVILIDGKFTISGLNIKQESIIDGDALILSISAASIIAKVHRDRIMKENHDKFPVYGFDNHKGYATKEHKNAIKKHGICPIHRRSFVLK